MLGNVEGPFAANGYKSTVGPICMVSNIIATNIFQQGSQLEPEIYLLWESFMSAGPVRDSQMLRANASCCSSI